MKNFTHIAAIKTHDAFEVSQPLSYININLFNLKKEGMPYFTKIQPQINHRKDRKCYRFRNNLYNHIKRI